MASKNPPTVFARVLLVVRRIPRGRVATYGQVAVLAGLPRHARHVGYALHALPDGTALPWHRVLGAGGALRLRDWGAAETQRMRLLREGVRFGPRGRVPLERFGWRPEAAARRELLREAVRAASSASSRPPPRLRRPRLDPRRSVG